MSHPVATPIQHEHEHLAVALTQHPIVKAAFERVGQHWLAKAGPARTWKAVSKPHSKR